jgi:hypothetical protein
MARPQKRAQAQQQTVLFIDESGFYPLPSVVRTYAPVGQTPILREWRTRDHLAAISAISPEGKLYFHCQDHAINSADVVAFLEHLLREVPGRILIIWDGSPIHRSRVIKEFLAHGAAQRLHLERLPAYAPELNPDEGMWQRLKGVELRNLCCSICVISGLSSRMPSNASVENHGLSKPVLRVHDFSDFYTGQ